MICRVRILAAAAPGRCVFGGHVQTVCGGLSWRRCGPWALLERGTLPGPAGCSQESVRARRRYASMRDSRAPRGEYAWEPRFSRRSHVRPVGDGLGEASSIGGYPPTGEGSFLSLGDASGYGDFAIANSTLSGRAAVASLQTSGRASAKTLLERASSATVRCSHPKPCSRFLLIRRGPP